MSTPTEETEMAKRLSGKLSYANVVATLALFIAMGGGAYAATNLPKNSVGTRQIKPNAVTAPKLANGAVIGRTIANGTITGLKLTSGTVTSVKIARGAVNSAKIANGSVTLADLAGADIKGAIDIDAIAAHTCGLLDLSVPDAQPGQIPLMTFTGNVALPTPLVVLAVKVVANGSVRGKVCNPTDNASAATNNIGVRVITLK